MELKDILSISGQPGLYKFIAQGKNGLIVESLENQKRMSAHASQKISSLEDIAIFTDDKEIPLSEVFKRIYEKESGKPGIDHKSDPTQIKKYFEEIVPEYDRDRVYLSDIKKVVAWYNQLVGFEIMGEELWKKKEEEDMSEKTENKDQEKHFEGVKEKKPASKKPVGKKTKEPSAKTSNPATKSGGKLKNVGVKKT
jgi:hypothetical protein